MNELELHRIEKVYGTPDYVQGYQETADLSVLPSTSFAGGDREYPVHTKAACFLSHARFWESAASRNNPKDNDIAADLVKYASFWNIDEDTKSVMQKVASTVVKSAADLSDDQFALVAETPEGETFRRYPVMDVSTTEKSAEAFYSERFNYPFAIRHNTANALFEKLSEFNGYVDSEVADYIEMAAGKGGASGKDLAQAFFKRAEILHRTRRYAEQRIMGDHAHKLMEMSSSPEMCKKAAESLDEYDQEHGLYEYYGTELNLPELDCHKYLSKHAQEELQKYAVTSTRNTYLREDIEHAGLLAFEALNKQAQVKNALGNFDFEKASHWLSHAPVDEVAEVENFYRVLNIQPVDLAIDLSQALA